MPSDLFHDPIKPDGSISTSSRLRVWWLRLARGYVLDSTRKKPKQNLFGELYYTTEWVLRKRS